MVGRIFFYLLMFAGIFYANFKISSYVIFIINLLAVVILATSFVMAIIFRFGISADIQRDEGVANRGEKYIAKVIIKNKTIIPILRVKVCLKVKVSGHKHKIVLKGVGMCPAKSSTIVEIPVRCDHCGTMTLEVIKAYVFDYLLLFRFRKKLSIITQIVILPKLPRLEVINMMTSQLNDGEDELYSTEKPGDDPTEIFAIREYVGGDKIRNIHWKLSSKLDKLMVKDYGMPLHNNDTIVVDTLSSNCNTKQWQKIMDEYYDLLYGLVYVMTKRGYSFWVSYIKGTYEHKKIVTQNDIHNLFTDIYDIKPYENENSCAKMYYVQRTQTKHRIFYITQFLNDETSANMHLLAEVGPVYYLIPGHVLNERMPVKFVGQRR